MTKQELFERCQKFDWFYQYSDDNRVFVKWNNQEKILREAQKELGVSIFDDYATYIFSRNSKDATPKPKLEDYL